MKTLIYADVFFFITAITVLLVGVALLVGLVYVIRILRDFKDVSARIRDETELITKDIDDLREDIKEEGVKMRHFFKFFSSIYKRKKGRK